MTLRQLLGFVLVFVLLVAGVWFLGRSERLGPDSVARQRALGALAPAGSGGQAESVAADNEPVIWHEPVEGSSIDLSQPLPDVPPGDTQYDLWMRGEIDLEQESLVSEAEVAALQEEALLLEPSANIQIAQEGPGLFGPSLGVSFDSLNISECCGGAGATVPPDPELAVGPSHIIAAVNIAFEIYNKSGATLLPQTTFTTLFAGVPGCSGQLFDPNVLYDEQADRFILGIDSNGNSYCVAVSQTSNPVGVWNRYRFVTNSAGGFFDYPHAGVGRNALYMGGNMFVCSTCGFKDARVWAFDKVAMYAGLAAGSVERVFNLSEDTPQPANLHGFAQGAWPASGPHYIVTETNFNGATYSVFAWNDPFGANTLVKNGTFNLVTATGVPAGFPINVPQSGGGSLQANDFRPHDAEYRNGFIWTANTIACNPGGGTVDCVRWAQINPVNGTVVQAGVLASNGQYRFFGNLAVNHCNDMAIGYTKSSSGMFPAVFIAGRNAEQPLNTLSPEIQLKAGEVNYTAFDGSPHRWGDYTGFTSDPNGQDIWYLGQYSKNTGSGFGRWGTYIGRFTFPDSIQAPAPQQAPAGGSSFVYLPIIKRGICS
ncbi:MAG: hypothetical protein L0332_26550 [Chloroflexi bacterium]|nr:hypothetical protein [Chloroflexota bacterium]MCI0577890.1 hypothetical protein [Chloroflexota bacterium]MCI0644474.1 hypothetical protein [Chloroflexota bacterium]MCI0730258.1 hypothetical protein [Chloroflexota bacterium]